MGFTSNRLLLSLFVGFLLTVSAGTVLAVVAANEERRAKVRWREIMDSRYGPGVVGEGRGSEYTFAGGIVINSMVAGMFIMPISFVIGSGLSMLRAKRDHTSAEQSHPPEPVATPDSSGKPSPPAR